MSCQNGKNLFEPSCDSNGFLIKINQDGTIKILEIGWNPRNFRTFIFKLKLSFLTKNHNNDNQGEFRDFKNPIYDFHYFLISAIPIVVIFTKKINVVKIQ